MKFTMTTMILFSIAIACAMSWRYSEKLAFAGGLACLTLFAINSAKLLLRQALDFDKE